MQERIISFDSHVTLPLDFGNEGSEADKDGPGRFDLAKAAQGRLSGAALTIFAWPESWTGANSPHRPTPGFVEAARHTQEVRYNAITAMVRDFPERVAIAYTPQDMRRLHGEGKFAVFLSMLNAYALGTISTSSTAGRHAGCACSASATSATTAGPTRLALTVLQ